MICLQMNDFPHVKRNWENTFEWLIKNKWTKTQQINDKELAFKWWIIGKSFKKFYADEVLQQKIEF